MTHFTLRSILSAFHYPEKLLQSTAAAPMEYFGVNLYYPGTELFRHCLYLAEGTSVPEALTGGLYGCILIPPAEGRVTGPLAAETVLWPESVPAGVLLNRIQNLYLSTSSQSRMAHILMSALTLNASIGSLIHQAAGILQNAVLLLDPAYQVIAMEGFGCQIDDIFWQDCLTHGRVSEEHVLLIKNFGLTKDLEQSSSTALWDGGEVFNHIPRLAQKIYSADHRYLGTIAVMQCRHAFTAEDYFLLDALVETLSSVLADFNPLTPRQREDAALLSALLRGEKPEEAAPERWQTVSEHPFFLAGYLPLREPAVARLGAYLQAALLSQREGILTAQQGQNVILLAALPDGKAAEETAAWLREKLAPLGVRAGLSPAFSDAMRFRQALVLAEEAVLLCEGGAAAERDAVCFHHHIAYLTLLRGLSPSALEEYVRKSPIAPLRTPKYAEFYKTLLCFVRHLGGYAETAQALYIHKNTLLYRMNKIQTLTGLDYTSPRDILSAALALAVNEYLRARDEPGQ